MERQRNCLPRKKKSIGEMRSNNVTGFSGRPAEAPHLFPCYEYQRASPEIARCQLDATQQIFIAPVSHLPGPNCQSVCSPAVPCIHVRRPAHPTGQREPYTAQLQRAHRPSAAGATSGALVPPQDGNRPDPACRLYFVFFHLTVTHFWCVSLSSLDRVFFGLSR